MLSGNVRKHVAGLMMLAGNAITGCKYDTGESAASDHDGSGVGGLAVTAGENAGGDRWLERAEAHVVDQHRASLGLLDGSSEAKATEPPQDDRLATDEAPRSSMAEPAVLAGMLIVSLIGGVVTLNARGDKAVQMCGQGNVKSFRVYDWENGLCAIECSPPPPCSARNEPPSSLAAAAARPLCSGGGPR